MEDYKYIDLAKESVNKRMIIWYYANPIDKVKILNKIPLSKKVAIEYWNEQKDLDLTDNATANNMINRITNGTTTRFIFLYDSYPEYHSLLDAFIYAASVLSYEKNLKREVGSRYMTTINIFFKFLKSENYQIYEPSDLTSIFQEELLVYLNLDRGYIQQLHDIRNLVELLVFILNEHNLENIINSQVFVIKRKAKNNKSKTDIPQEILIQLLAASVKDINEYMNKVKELESWRKIYNNKKFDSLENIANAYFNYPNYFDDYEKLNAKQSAIFAHRKRFNGMAIDSYGIDLTELSEDKLSNLIKNGKNINDFLNPFIMAWFFDDIIPNFPLNNGKEYVYTATPMSEYSRYNYNSNVMAYIKPYGQSSLKFKQCFDDIFTRKYPSSSDIFPFFLYWIIQTGSNNDAVINMKNSENIGGIEYEIGDYFVEENTAIIKSYKNRGTGDWYYFSLDKKERNGLYDYLVFLKNILKPLWNYDKTDLFWVYANPKNTSKGSIITEFKRFTIKAALKIFISKHNILDENGEKLENINMGQLRNSFITMMDLKDMTIEEIQEAIRHNSFDTRFKFYNDSKDLQHRNFSVINAIQEAIMETAKIFQGSIHLNAINVNQHKKYEEVFLSKCSNINNPQFSGSKKLENDEICVDWDNCLQCKNSRVFLEHLPKICQRIKQYEDMKKIMTIHEWENNFKIKYDVAQNTLERWISSGGSDLDIENAWLLVNENKVFLPNIFPTGSMIIKKEIK